ncbi:MAG: chromosomal replication initiator protein DnaA [Planctomycetaceae bacterium]|nr:chromosomal replication initiator protein DnaA [Planctomycetaceae bacterium]
MDCNQELVSRIQRALVAQLGERRYGNWFEKTRLEVCGEVLIVWTSSPYLQSWMQRQFAQTLQTAAGDVIGPGVRVRFDVEAAPESLIQNGSPPQPEKPQLESLTSRRDAVPRTAASRRRFADLSEFIAGSKNELAYTAARQVAENPGGPLNPLCIYGGVGCGKTHLLEGIYRQVRRDFPALQVLFLTAENFANYFTQALRERSLPSFHQKFRNVDVLLVDDVDFFHGKSGIEEEFLHTLKSLESLGRQVVLTADRHPRLLNKMSDELVTRMLAGLACRLESSDLPTRLEIVRQRVRRQAFPVADEALDFIARRFSNNVRELEGAVNCLHTFHLMSKRRVTLQAARDVLARLERDCIRVVRLDDVEQAVCRMFQITADDLRSARRSRSVSQPRMLAMYLARRLTSCAYSEIGQFFGNRNHSTVMAAEKKIRRLIDAQGVIRVCADQWPLHEVIDSLESQLKTGS